MNPILNQISMKAFVELSSSNHNKPYSSLSIELDIPLLLCDLMTVFFLENIQRFGDKITQNIKWGSRHISTLCEALYSINHPFIPCGTNIVLKWFIKGHIQRLKNWRLPPGVTVYSMLCLCKRFLMSSATWNLNMFHANKLRYQSTPSLHPDPPILSQAREEKYMELDFWHIFPFENNHEF